MVHQQEVSNDFNFMYLYFALVHSKKAKGT